MHEALVKFNQLLIDKHLIKHYKPQTINLRILGSVELLSKDPAVIHPHSFRHMYAKAFLNKRADLSTLADILGHESIKTTQIYLRRSRSEQKRIIDKIVTW